MKSQKTEKGKKNEVKKSWLNTSQIKTIPRHIMGKELKTKDKEKILKAAQPQKDTTHTEQYSKINNIL